MLQYRISSTKILRNEIDSKLDDNILVKRNGATKLTLTNAYTFFNFIRKEDRNKVLDVLQIL